MISSTKILMELELGLALPNHNPGRLDLNCNINNNGLEIIRERIKSHKNQKRAGSDDQDGIDEVESKALSLLLWSGQPNEEDENWRKLHLNAEIKYDDEENQEIVGWPPITSLRKELLHSGQQYQGNNWMANRNRRERVIAVRNSMYVKVKMEGVAIGRKIDLGLYTSYPALTNTLINMFAKYSRIHRSYADYRILYQDREGDWMLAGDIPWETFIESVQRIEILRNNRDS